MESKKVELELKDKIPKERRIRTKDTKGELDEDGFFITPNGSFWDMDGEYFNHYGFDIHGGKYVDKLDYIPGPTWIEELGCYPEDKDKYQNEEDLKDEMDNGGDEDLNNFDKDEDIINKIDKIEIKKHGEKEDININKKGKKNKKKKEESLDEDEWEEIED